MFKKTNQHNNTSNNTSLFNKGANSFIQPKLNIGKPGDKYEVEADNVADQVVAKGKDPSTTFFDGTPAIQKQTEEVQQGQETLQEKPIAETITPVVQLKPEEELQQKEDEEIQKNSEENDIQTKEASEQTINETITPIQKQAEEEIQEKEEEDVQEKEEETSQTVQMAGGDENSSLENNLASSKGGGSPLESNTKNEMESGFGADFSNVRVHNDSNAVQMNQQLGSQAFTNGNDIYFNEGKYNPESDSGKHLLAHELTHTVQQGASKSANVQKAEDTAPATEPGMPTTVIDITNGLELSDDWLAYVEANPRTRNFDVQVKIGSQFTGTIKLKKLGTPAEGEKQKFELNSTSRDRHLDVQGMEFLNPLRTKGIHPVLVLKAFGTDQQTTGFLSVRTSETVLGDVLGLIKEINKNLEAMSFLGLSPIEVAEGLENEYTNGGVNFKANNLKANVDGYIEATGSMGITNSSFTFELNSNVDVAGLASGEFNLSRGEDGKLSGRASIGADIANVNANLTIEYDKGAVTIQGTGRMNSEKFSGEITLLVTDEAKSRQMMHAALGTETLDAEANAATPATPEVAVTKTKNNQVLAGWGEVQATITPWLEGTAKVGIDSQGHVTIVGEIVVPNEIELMEQRGKKVDIFSVEIRAGYGIPLVGQVFLFASIGMFANAGFGPLVLKDVGFTGTYSTDPSVLQEFSITGTLGINAFAILGLEAEAGVGVTLLGHDVKAGVNVTAAAGLRAYAEATPTFQYKESAAPEGGKVGESRLKGHFEAAAQLFLQLSGALFYELDSPWWSPAPDGREEYPLGEVQYPIGDSMGIGADMDWLVGSNEVPELSFSPVEFDPDKFTADVMADPPPRKMGDADANPEGEWTGEPGQERDTNPDITGDADGLPANSRKEEDLKKLPDEQKYMRALDEMSKLENADPKPTYGVVDEKAKKVKRKYGLDKIELRNKEDDNVSVFVKHAQEDNGKHLLKVPLMSEAERIRLLHTAMTDLRTRERAAAGEENTLDETGAKAMLEAWKTVHPIIEEARVVDGSETWDYFIDIGDKTETEKGVRKKEAEDDFEHEKVKDDFVLKTGDKHKLYLREGGQGGYELIMESTPTLYQNFIEQFTLPANASEEQKKLKQDALDLALKIGRELDKLTTQAGGGLGNSSERAPENEEEEFDQWVDQLADLTEQLMNASYGASIPDNEAVWGPMFDGAFGSSASINYLSTKTTGAQSSSKKFIKHDILDSRKSDSGERPYYLRGHLLNGNLHGPNDWKNLTPLTYSANTAHKDQIESELTKHLTNEGVPLSSDARAFKYIVIAQYGRGVNSGAKSAVDASTEQRVIDHADTIKKIIDAEAFVPRHLEIKAIELKPTEDGQWVEDKVVFNNKIQNDIDQSPEAYNIKGKAPDFVKFSSATYDSLKKWFDPAAAQAMIDAKTMYPNTTWTASLLQEKALPLMPESVRDGRKMRKDKIEKHIKFKENE